MPNIIIKPNFNETQYNFTFYIFTVERQLETVNQGKMVYASQILKNPVVCIYEFSIQTSEWKGHNT